MMNIYIYIYIYLGTLRYHFFLAIWPEWTVRRNSTDMGGTESIWSNLGFQEFQKVSQPIPSIVFSVPGHLCWDTYLNSLVRPPCSLQTLCEQLNAISQFFHQQSPVNLQLLGSTSTTKVFHFFHIWFQMEFRDCSKEMITRLKVTGRKSFYNFAWYELLPRFLIPTSLLSRIARTCGHARIFLERSVQSPLLRL